MLGRSTPLEYYKRAMSSSSYVPLPYPMFSIVRIVDDEICLQSFAAVAMVAVTAYY